MPATTHVPRPKGKQSRLALCALVFSIITMICCGCSLISLAFSVPALIMAVAALTTTGSAQKKNAAVSIALNVGLVICTVVVLVIVVPVYTVNTGSTSSSYWPSGSYYRPSSSYYYYSYYSYNY